MNSLGSGGVVRVQWSAPRMLGAFLVVGCLQGAALAQNQAPAKPQSASSEIKTPFLDNYTPSEEVKRRALGPLRIIKQTADQKRPAAAPAETPAKTAASTPASAVAPKAKRDDAPAKVADAAPVVDAPAAAVVAPPALAAITPPPAPAPAVAVAPVVEAKRVVNQELIAISQDYPVFSRSLMRDNPRGVVKVAFDVMPNGSTADVQVVSSSNRRLNSAAVEAVAKWKFKPIDEAMRVDIELAFSLD